MNYVTMGTHSTLITRTRIIVHHTRLAHASKDTIKIKLQCNATTILALEASLDIADSNFGSYSLVFLCKHILIMSDSDSELNKYRIPTMTVIFKGMTQPKFKTFCYKCYNGWAKYSLVIVEWPHFWWPNLNKKSYDKKLLMDYFQTHLLG